MRKQPKVIVVLMCFYFFTGSGLCSEQIESSSQAIVKGESVAVYSEMSAGSKILKSLKKGEKVAVEIEMGSSDGTWCGIVEQGQTTMTGYVDCRDLEREEPRGKTWQSVRTSVGREASDGSDMNETNVTIEGNSVLIPATLGYKDRTVEAMLLLDTGASISLINTEVAEKLGISPAETKIEAGRVVGGGLILLFMTRLNYITAGPNTKNKMPIGVVVHKGPPVKFDGLLGMDFLRGLKYYIDFKNRIIKWEPQ